MGKGGYHHKTELTYFSGDGLRLTPEDTCGFLWYISGMSDITYPYNGFTPLAPGAPPDRNLSHVRNKMVQNAAFKGLCTDIERKIEAPAADSITEFFWVSRKTIRQIQSFFMELHKAAQGSNEICHSGRSGNGNRNKFENILHSVKKFFTKIHQFQVECFQRHAKNNINDFM